MKLSDIVSNANLELYPIIAMVAFIIACLGIAYYVLSRRNAPVFARARMMPLEDAATVAAPSQDKHGHDNQRELGSKGGTR